MPGYNSKQFTPFLLTQYIYQSGPTTLLRKINKLSKSPQSDERQTSPSNSLLPGILVVNPLNIQKLQSYRTNLDFIQLY